VDKYCIREPFQEVEVPCTAVLHLGEKMAERHAVGQLMKTFQEREIKKGVRPEVAARVAKSCYTSDVQRRVPLEDSNVFSTEDSGKPWPGHRYRYVPGPGEVRLRPCGVLDVGIDDHPVKCNVLFDSGSQQTIISKDFATQDDSVIQKLGVVNWMRGDTFGKNNDREVTATFSVPFLTGGGRRDHLKYVVACPGLAPDETEPAGLDAETMKEFFPEVDPCQVVQPGGRIDLIVGMDNCHLFPREIRRSRGMILYETFQGTKIIAGLYTLPKTERKNKSEEEAEPKGPEKRGRGGIKPGGLFPMMLSLMMLSIPAADAFVAYNCANGSNPVIPYSLLEPEPCALTGVDLKFERTLNGEIIQMRRERIISVQRCTVMESTFSQYCGHSSAAGVTRYLKFHEPRLVEAQHCQQSFSQGGKIKINNEKFKAVIGTTSSHSTYAAGDLDDASHCTT